MRLLYGQPHFQTIISKKLNFKLSYFLFTDGRRISEAWFRDPLLIVPQWSKKKQRPHV